MDLNPSIGRQKDGRPRIGDDRLAAARAKVRQGAFGGIVDSKPRLGDLAQFCWVKENNVKIFPVVCKLVDLKNGDDRKEKHITVSANPRT